MTRFENRRRQTTAASIKCPRRQTPARLALIPLAGGESGQTTKLGNDSVLKS